MIEDVRDEGDNSTTSPATREQDQRTMLAISFGISAVIAGLWALALLVPFPFALVLLVFGLIGPAVAFLIAGIAYARSDECRVQAVGYMLVDVVLMAAWFPAMKGLFGGP